MRDDVVKLAGNPRALFDNRLTCNDVAFALGDLRASLSVTNDTTDEEHRDQRDGGERRTSFGLTPDRDGDQRRQRHEGRADCKKPWCRPDRKRVERAEPGDPEADGVGWFPRDRDDVGDQSGGYTRRGGISAAEGNGACHQRPGDRDDEALLTSGGPEPC